MSTHHTRTTVRWLLLSLAVIGVLVLLSGCAGGPPPPPLTPDDHTSIANTFTQIENKLRNTGDMKEKQITDLQTSLDFGPTQLQSTDATVKARANFFQGYYYESQRNYAEAYKSYKVIETVNSAYRPLAAYRIGILAERGLIGATPKESYNLAKQYLRQLIIGKIEILVRNPELASEGGVLTATSLQPPAKTVVTTPQPSVPTLTWIPAAQYIEKKLDTLYQSELSKHSTSWDYGYYKSVDVFMKFFRKLSPTYGVVIALFFLALLVKLITMPLTTMAFSGMRDMQRIQPLLKELQEKYKDDRQKQAEEQMRIMKEHNVKPASGCLPMLIQLPVFIIVYQAVQVYLFQFSSAHFLWIGNLASPDWILLILYAVSLVITQKLTATPSADPQQQMIQNQMTYFMPIFMVLVLQTIASAFVLYWFFLNVMSSLHQYYLMQRFKQEEAAKGLTIAAQPTPPTPGKKKGKRL